ncbi:Hypothetical Protein FCC1311_060242 [Hondaea fermentalgiana]|uniref:Uncharacterized protein n=1 Tax=Hondaea fermentalgiana TaxID=2315210 RepID=A0A2R5GPK1_9STRA|nr:Hypothetical Protein FCC1311_060242 [Hondaea fermentalgiana]|eukprot:GBG29804.1 Hypothetical Protein FCC1311_060242 [Hondaea fermentalgiana]
MMGGLVGRSARPLRVDVCVICARAGVANGAPAPYLNYDAEYADECIVADTEARVSGCFVRFSIGDYMSLPGGGFRQILPEAPAKSRWLENLFYFASEEHFLHDGGDPALLARMPGPWCACECSRDCRQGVLAGRGAESRDLGAGGAALDISRNGLVVCVQCHAPVRSAVQDNDTRVYKLSSGRRLAQCAFCGVAVGFKQRNTVQTCTTCRDEMNAKNEALSRVCHYCRVPLAGSRSAHQKHTLIIDNTPVQVLLCRKHRVRVAPRVGTISKTRGSRGAMRSSTAAVAVAVVCALLAPASAQEHSLCACTDCCHVDTLDVSYKNMVSLDYPSVSLSGNYTVLSDGGTHDINGTTYDGTPYQYVLKYQNTPVDSFDVNMRIFTAESDVVIDCSQSFVFYGTEEDAAVYHKIPLESVTDGGSTYCRMDINEKLSRDELSSDSNIYFAFDRLVDERTEFKLMIDGGNPIVPIDDILDYQYFLNQTVLGSNVSDANYYINIDLTVSDINDMEIDGTGCMTLQEIMRRVHLNGDAENCTLEYLDGFVEPADPADFGSVLYRYKLPQADFEKCSTSVVSNGEEVVFKTRLNLDVRNDEETCFYFQPGFAEQAVSVTLKAEITDEATEQFAQFSSELIDVEIERCTPIEDYVIPQAIVKVVIETTSANEDIRWNEASIPTLGADAISLYGGHDPEVTTPVPTYNCTTASGVTTCHHYFHTRECSKIYTTQDGECAFERTDLNYIDNLVFQEFLDASFYLTHRTARIETNLEYTEFAVDQCSAPDNRALINVEDEFPSSIGVRNYYQGVGVDWDNTTQIRFDDKVMIRMSAGEAAGVEFDDLELFIKNVVVTLREPTDDNDLIAQMSFNVAEKAFFLNTDWSLFYEDPVFCSYYESGDEAERCQSFFENGRTNALNADGESLSSSNVAHICHKEGAVAGWEDSRNIDYFVFDPKVWFADLYSRAYLRVDITATAVIHSCGASGSRRLREVTATTSMRGNSRALADEDAINYVSDDVVIIFGAGANETVSVVSISERAEALLARHKTIIVVLAAFAGALTCAVVAFVAKNRKHRQVSSEKSGKYSPVGSKPVESQSMTQSSSRSYRY